MSRIGVDATCWPNRRGYGRFARSLLTATLAVDRANAYVFFVDTEEDEFPLPDGVEVVRVATKVPTTRAAGAAGRRTLGDMWAVSRAISRSRVDLVFFPSVYSYVPLVSNVPQLVTIHDVIAELFPKLIFPTRKARTFWDTKVKLACLQARLILTVSDYSMRRLAEQLRVPLPKIRVIPEAGDPAFRPMDTLDGATVRAEWKLPPGARILVYVGGFSPHKNLSFLVNVFAELRAQPRFSNAHLFLVGDYQKDVFYSCHSELRAEVGRLKLTDSVVFTGYCEDERLRQLFHIADLVLLPSFCEGFGLPPVEAAACGTPSVVTTESPLVDLLGEGTVGVPPHDRPGWVRVLANLLDDDERRRRMGAAAQEAAARLSWESSARQLLAIFDEVLQPHAPAH